MSIVEYIVMENVQYAEKIQQKEEKAKLVAINATKQIIEEK